MQYFEKPNINFTGRRYLFFLISLISVVGGILAAIIFPPVLGIDFSGGSEVAIEFKQDIQTAKLRSVIEQSGIKGSEIKSYGKEGQFLIRTKKIAQVDSVLSNIIKSKLPTHEFNIIKVDNLEPKIGREIGLQAIFAVLLALVAILIYIAFRFEFIFGLGAVIGVFHDTAFTFTFIIAFNHLGIIDLELNQTIVAALLTVVGYSINDTVIVFDRIRENREKYKGFDFIRMVNLSINETLSRTINTVGTTLIVLLTLTLLGGPVLQGFAFTMMIGILVGTYSSVFVAGSFVIWYMQKIKKIEMKEFTGKDEDALPAKA